jgi:hypothetical protein
MWAAINTWRREINTYQTTDGGENWTDISQLLPPGIRINAILHQSNSVNTLYAGTNKGVYFCDDSTSEWRPFSENLPITIVNDLELQESTGEIFAATYGRGIWKTNLRPDDIKEQQKINTKIEIFPNPVTDKITLKFENTDFGIGNEININIIDIRGLEVFNGSFKLENSITLNPKLPIGVYFINLKIGGKEYSGKFIKL